MRVKELYLFIILLPFLISGMGKKNIPPEIIPEKEQQAAEPPNILFLLADDWSYPHAGIYGDPVVKTPTFDRIAEQGMLFSNAFAIPSCTPSRASILTGQYPHRLEEGANLWGSLPEKFPVYTELLAQNGYEVGFMRKGWSPGNYKAGGRAQDPTGTRYTNFDEFLNELPDDKPFAFWFGSKDPHRPYYFNSGLQAGMDSSKVQIPEYLPDHPTVRNDILDYYLEVERFDRESGDIINILEKSGRLDNTIVVMTGDNGWPFPRAKATLYDGGTRVPLAIQWGDEIQQGQKSEALVPLMDLAPTFLEAAGVEIPDQVTGRSLLPILKENRESQDRDKVFLERERHAYVSEGNVGYPMRAIRTDGFLYIRNLKPERWPSGKPRKVAFLGPYGDIDGSPTKNYIMQRQKDAALLPGNDKYFEMAFLKRPAEELYDLEQDPDQINNVVDKLEYKQRLEGFREILDRWMKETKDPRTTGSAKFDEYPYYGGSGEGYGDMTGPPPMQLDRIENQKQ